MSQKRVVLAALAAIALAGAGFVAGYAARGSNATSLPSPVPSASEARLIRMPDVVGRPRATATTLLNRLGLRVRRVYRNPWTGAPVGTIVTQHPAAGRDVFAGSTVVLRESVLCDGCSSVVAPHARPGTITKIYTKGWPASVLVMPHDVWATVPSRQALLRIDPETNAVLATIHLGGRPGAIALAPGALWVRVAFNTYSAAVRIDPSTDHIVASVPLGAIYGGIATTPGAVWVTGHDRGIVQRIDPRTNTVAATMRGTVEGGGILSYLGAVWVYADGGSLVKIDPHTKTVITVSAGVGHSNVTAGDGSLWLASNDDVLRIDPASATVRRRIRVTGCYPAPVGCSLVYGDGFVWMERSGAPPDDIYRIDPRTAHVRRVLRLSLGYPGYLLAAGHGALWGSGPDAIWRIAE